MRIGNSNCFLAPIRRRGRPRVTFCTENTMMNSGGRSSIQTLTLAIAIGLISGAAGVASAQGLGKFEITKLAEKPIDALPEGELYWQVETYPSIEDAQAKAGDYALAAEHDGKAWLFSLAERDEAGMGGTVVAKIGPVPSFEAPEYLIRINSATAPVGAKTSIHTHPGPESFLVLSGQLTQHTPYSTHVLNEGATMSGVPDQTMQIFSTGEEELQELIMFVVDATRPFSEKKEHLH